MQMIEVNTSELAGPALDWAVAKAIGSERIEIHQEYDEIYADTGPEIHCNYSPSTDWSQGGPLIEANRVELRDSKVKWNARIEVPNLPRHGTPCVISTGETMLIAAMRAVVAAKLGDVVQVPAELMRENNHDS